MSSSVVAADPKVRFSEVLNTSCNTLPTLSTEKCNVPSLELTHATNTNNQSVLCTSVPAAAVTNISTLIGYAPALGDGDIVRAVRDHNNNNQVNWAQLDKKLKKPEGYSRDRYFNVLRKYAMYDVTITRAVLSAQVKNQPVQWALLDQQYTLGRAEARWNQVLRAHCDMKGVTVNGILRPELYIQYRNTTGPAEPTTRATVDTDTAMNTNANTNNNAFANNAAINTNVNANSSTLAIRSAVTHAVSSGDTSSRVAPIASSSNNLQHTAPELYNVRPFTVAEDQQLRCSIDFVLKKKMPIDLSWTTIGRFMNRTVASVKARWNELIAAERQSLQQAQAQLHANASVNLPLCSASGLVPSSAGSFGYHFVAPLQVPTKWSTSLNNAHLAQVKTPAVTNANAVLPQHYGSNAIFIGTTPNNNPYTPAEDNLILARIPTSIQAPGANLPMFVYNQFLQLSYELNRPLASVRERWQTLLEMSMTARTRTPVAVNHHGRTTSCERGNYSGYVYVGSSASNASIAAVFASRPNSLAVDQSSGVNRTNGLLAQPSQLNNAYHRSLFTKPPEPALPSIPLASKSVPLPVPFSAASVPFATSSTHVKPAAPAILESTTAGTDSSKHTTAIASPTPAMPVSLFNSTNSIGGLLSQHCLLNNTTSQSVFSNSKPAEQCASKPLPSIPLASKSLPLPVQFSAASVPFATSNTHVKSATSAILDSITVGSNASKLTTAIAATTQAMPVSLFNGANSMHGLLSQHCLLSSTTNQSAFSNSEQSEHSAAKPLPSIPLASKSQPLPIPFSAASVSIAVPAKNASTAASVIANNAATSENHSTISHSTGNSGSTSGTTVVDITNDYSANNLSGLISQPCLLNTSINASVFALSEQAECISTPLPSIPVASKSLPLPTTFPIMPVTHTASAAIVDTIDLGLHAAGVESEEPMAVESTVSISSHPDSLKFNTGVFTSAEDQTILTAVPLSDHLDFYGEEWNARFAQLCQELNRSATTITQRWLQLIKAGKTTHGRPKINTSTPRNKNFTGTKTMQNISTAGEVSLASLASQTTHDCADLNPVDHSDAPVVNATDNNSCKSPYRRVDVLTVGGQKVMVRKTVDPRTVSTPVSVDTIATSATDRGHSSLATSTSTEHNAAKAQYCMLNVVKKTEQTQSTPATGQERSPATVRFDNTAAEDARIMEVVTSVLSNGSKSHSAWENLAIELSRDVLSLKSRWLQIFKTKRSLDRSSSNRASSQGLARLLTVQAALPQTSVEENSLPVIPAISTHATPVSPALPDINTPSKPTTADNKNDSKTADVTSPTLSLNSTRSHEMSSSTGLKLAMSPLQLDNSVNPTRVVVFPSRENLHDAYVDSESGDYW